MGSAVKGSLRFPHQASRLILLARKSFMSQAFGEILRGEEVTSGCNFWLSTTRTDNTSNAYKLNTNNGNVNNNDKTNSYYLRYVDDFIILGKRKSKLKSLISKTNNFLKQTLRMKLNPDKTKLKRIKKGIDFLGYLVKPHYVLIRKRVIKTLKKKIKELSKNPDKEQALAVINSYYGHFKHADSFNLKKSIYENSEKLQRHFNSNQSYAILSLE